MRKNIFCIALARISHDGVRVKGEQAQINENRDELEHSAPWRSNSLGKLRSDRGEMALERVSFG
jgi:hypothetical protein